MRINYDWYLSKKIDERWGYYDRYFSDQECDSIVNLYTSSEYLNKLEFGKISPSTENTDFSIRNSRIFFIPSSNEDSQWIFKKVASAVLELNEKLFQLDIEKIETLQFSEYTSSYSGMYNPHIDNIYESCGYRKLSFSIQLSDENSYEGGDLLLHIGPTPTPAKKTKGTISIFPSYTLHEVTPVTKGTRYSLVGWVWGPKFK